MPSDKARVTFDEARRYRSVVMQQGRVTLEADWNEQAQIAAEELRHDLRDLIGPFGTPDNGYEIAVSGGNITIGPGTMYVGGVRVFLPPRPDKTPYPFDQQPDWMLATSRRPARPTRELIWLELFEQEISAVEDPALLEPALGGPDTAQRLRLMQRVRRGPTSRNNCIEAWSDFLADRDFDRDMMMFRSRSRLRVEFVGQGLTPDPCDPAADPGYLGAENQLIRVAVAAPAAAGGQQRLLWSFDNASFLHRVTSYDATARTLVLATRPPDDAHKPRIGQVVELLRGYAHLGDDAIAAAPFGPVAVLAKDYAADDRMLTLTDVLPPEVVPTATMPLYVRVWEEALPFTANTPVTLGHTGIQVTLTLTSGTTFELGDFWTFAARPSTPSDVLPKRYEDAPQPPEGFRRWACPLAVINWTVTGGNPVTDCREHFDDLVTLSKRRGSCCVVVRPADLERRTLQQIIDAHTDLNQSAEFCLVPGDYVLSEPLLLRFPMTIAGCGPGVRIRAASGDGRAFRGGLIHIVSANEVTLCNLEIHLPRVPLPMGGADEELDLDGCVGVRIVDGLRCTIEECTFKYPPAPPAPPPPPPGTGVPPPRPAEGRASLSAGILAHGFLVDLTIRDNRFDGEVDLLRAPFGVVCIPSVYRKPGGRFGAYGSVIQQLHIVGNIFSFCHTAVMVWGDLAEVLVRENSCVTCVHGILLFARRWWAALAFADEDTVRRLRPMMESGVTAGASSAFAAYRFTSVLMFHPAILVATAAFSMVELPAAFKQTGPDLAEGPNPGAEIFLRTVSDHAVPNVEQFVTGGPMAKLLDALDQAWKDLPPPFQNLVTPQVRRLSLQDVFNTQPLFFGTLDVSHNQVNRSTTVNVPFGVAFIYAADERNASARLIASDNDWAGASPALPTALILFPARTTFTANIVQNEFTAASSDFIAPSLIFIPVARTQGSRPFAIIAAVTGNDFIGIPILPRRASIVPPGTALPPWFLLNTVVN